jgi:hypothetical protein
MLSAPFNPALAFVGMMATLSGFATFSLIDGILLGDPTLPSPGSDDLRASNPPRRN